MFFNPNNESSANYRNYDLLPKAKLLDENICMGTAANKALKRYNASSLLTLDEMMKIKKDLKTVNTLVDASVTRAIQASTALCKVVVKLETAIISRSPEFNGNDIEEDSSNSRQFQEFQRSMERQYRSTFQTKSALPKANAVDLDRSVHFPVLPEESLDQFLCELNELDIDDSIISEIPSIMVLA